MFGNVAPAAGNVSGIFYLLAVKRSRNTDTPGIALNNPGNSFKLYMQGINKSCQNSELVQMDLYHRHTVHSHDSNTLDNFL